MQTVITVNDHFPDTTRKLRRMVDETECWAIVQTGQRQRESYERCLYYQMKLIRMEGAAQPHLVQHDRRRAAHFARRAGLCKLAVHVEAELP